METFEQGGKALISGIEKDAEQDARKIVEEARKKAKELERYTGKQVESIAAEGEKKARAQSEEIRRRVLSGVDAELRRKDLRLRERIFGDVMNRVKEGLKNMIRKDAYRTVLLDWIVEAAVGLGAAEAAVSASRNERALIDGKLLERAENRVKELAGMTVRLHPAEDDLGDRQGVILTSSDGRTAFNNLVGTRLLRKQREVREMIYRELFEE
jgi:vacuolar-type H+-ATPase subunit E/Vma4